MRANIDKLALLTSTHVPSFGLLACVEVCFAYVGGLEEVRVLVPSKTKLLVYSTKSHQQEVNYFKNVNPITIGRQHVPFSNEEEHVGVLRHVSGNMPGVLVRAQSSLWIIKKPQR